MELIINLGKWFIVCGVAFMYIEIFFRVIDATIKIIKEN